MPLLSVILSSEAIGLCPGLLSTLDATSPVSHFMGPLHEKKAVAPTGGPAVAALRGGGWALCAGGIWELWVNLAFKNTCPVRTLVGSQHSPSGVLTCALLGKKGMEEVVHSSEFGKLYVKKVRFLFFAGLFRTFIVLHCAVNHY